MQHVCPECSSPFYVSSAIQRTFCSWQCRFSYGERPEVIRERFYSHVEVCSHGKTCALCCWPWRLCASRSKSPCFSFMVSGKQRNIVCPRFMYGLEYGPFDQSLEVCHNCPSGDNPVCISFHHLFLGTQKDNMDDMVRKGRSNRGEKNGGAKLTREQVREIRSLRENGLTLRVIADKFSISVESVRNIHFRKKWWYVE